MSGIDLYDTPEWTQGTRPLGGPINLQSARLAKATEVPPTLPSTHRSTAKTAQYIIFWGCKVHLFYPFAGLV